MEKSKDEMCINLKYDDNMDAECVGLCDMINSLDGCETFESCCGHGVRPYSIYFFCDSHYSLAVLARSVDRRYLNSWTQWIITLETTENSDREQYCYRLSSKSIYCSEDIMREDLNRIIKNIEYWSRPEFYRHFKR